MPKSLEEATTSRDVDTFLKENQMGGLLSSMSEKEAPAKDEKTEKKTAAPEEKAEKKKKAVAEKKTEEEKKEPEAKK